MEQLEMSIDWERFENFVGFGSPSASVVFIGMEEGIQRDADLIADLELRSTYEPYMDLAEAQAALGKPSGFFGADAKTQRTWRPMCHLMLRREGVAQPTLDQRVRYQADRLGRRDGDTLLTELLPYPHSDTGQWLYERFGRFATREAYNSEMLPRRVALLRRVLSGGAAELIVAYGKSHWGDFKSLIPTPVTWQPQSSFEVARWDGKRAVLAPHFATAALNTDEDLNVFANA